jgi:hypothetical protein
MVCLAERVAGIAKSLDGRGLSLYSLAAAVVPDASTGIGAWKDAVNRNERLDEALRRVVPPTCMGKVENNRKTTHVVLLEDAPDAVRFVLKQPHEFFDNPEAVEALAKLVGRDPVHRTALEVQRLVAEQEAQSLCLLPVLAGQPAPTQMRTSMKSGQVLGSVHNFVAWLGLGEHTWRHWLEEAFMRTLCPVDDQVPDQIRNPVLEHLVLPGTSNSTPMTNYAGFCLIMRLCAGKSAITDAMLDEATNVLGRIKVGDQRLHNEIQRNAASSSSEEKAFVVGPAEALAQQKTPEVLDMNALLLEAAQRPEVQVLMDGYWKKAIDLQTEVATVEAKAKTTEAQAKIAAAEAEAKAKIAAAEAEAQASAAAAEAEAKAKIAAAEAEAQASAAAAKTKVCEETTKRQLLSASRKAEAASHRANETEARCREAEAKRRLDELVPQRSARRARVIGMNNDTHPHHLERPLRGAALAALKALPPDPEYNAYRAAGIPDNAVPRDDAQARAWYELACRQQIQMRPSEGPEARLALRERGSRDIYGEPMRPEFCYPPYRAVV